ncbi:hypothetical protein [Pseudomonas fluorescens]|uniref:hypothetical protein n=1 Tax=Pseudomonas fluorescens TaxID=294 RepID=UPI001CD213B4|nr:hypothetical protein [Pseudomonas fluorescens]
MKITGRVEMEVVVEVMCDRCGGTTQVEGNGLQFGTMRAQWGYGSQHDGQVYELHLCETCFFAQLTDIKRERWTREMFSAEGDAIRDDDNFGLVEKGVFFGPSGS